MHYELCLYYFKKSVWRCVFFPNFTNWKKYQLKIR